MASTDLPAAYDCCMTTTRGFYSRPDFSSSSLADDSGSPGAAILGAVDPLDRLRAAGKRMTDPADSLAQHIAEHVVDLVVRAVDVNSLIRLVDLNAIFDRVDIGKVLARVDVNALLARVDVNPLLDRVDVNELLSRVDVNDLMRRIDMDELVGQTDLGAVIARSTGGAASEALDAARSQAVGLDQFIDRWVGRLLRRKQPAPPRPTAQLDARARS
jgi:hypothetical protein